MAAEWICDGCGKRASAAVSGDRRWIKPHDWLTRADKDGPQDACCRDCVETIAAKTGKTAIVLPL